MGLPDHPRGLQVTKNALDIELTNSQQENETQAAAGATKKPQFHKKRF